MEKLITLSTHYQDIKISNIAFDFEILKREKESDLGLGINFFEQGRRGFEVMNYPHYEIKFRAFISDSNVLRDNFKTFYKNLHIQKGIDGNNYCCITIPITTKKFALQISQLFAVGILWSLIHGGEKFDPVYGSILRQVNDAQKQIQFNDVSITIDNIT